MKDLILSILLSLTNIIYPKQFQLKNNTPFTLHVVLDNVASQTISNCNPDSKQISFKESQKYISCDVVDIYPHNTLTVYLDNLGLVTTYLNQTVYNYKRAKNFQIVTTDNALVSNFTAISDKKIYHANYCENKLIITESY